MRIRKKLSVAGVAVTVFSSGLATAAPAMAAQSLPPSYHLSGSYVLGRTITTCLRYAQGCSTAPFPVQVTGNGKSWQIMNTSGLWDHPLSLAFGSGAWRAAGMEPESTCNGATVPNTMVTIVLKMSGTSIKGVAQQLAGTLESDQGPTVCNSGSNSIGKWSVFTPANGAWPGNAGPYYGSNGPYYANLYYQYPDPQPASTTVCKPSGTGCMTDSWDFYWGQCTSWVAYRLSEMNSIKFSDHYRMKDGGLWGNAAQWQAAAKSIGIATSSTPVLGSVAWWPNSVAHEGGHVAYVEKVNSPTSIVISEMNYDNENGFRLVTITKSGGDWPGAFLHIADR